MNIPDLLIIRHGETEWNRAGLMQGHRDSALTALGRRQARHVNQLLSGVGLTGQHRAWTSPLGRAVATAELALRGHFTHWQTDIRLMEVGVGAFEGLSFEDALQSDPKLSAYPGPIGWQFHAPSGETYEGFRNRIEAWMQELDAPAVVVTHGITSRVMRGIALGLTFDQLGGLPGGQGIIHRIRGGVADTIG